MFLILNYRKLLTIKYLTCVSQNILTVKVSFSCNSLSCSKTYFVKPNTTVTNFIQDFINSIPVAFSFSGKPMSFVDTIIVGNV